MKVLFYGSNGWIGSMIVERWSEIYPDDTITCSTTRLCPENISIIEEEFVVSEDECSDCAICMENRENDKFCQLNCQHYFCVVCVQIILHLPRAFHCPLCREKVDTIKVMNSAYINP